MWQVKTDYESKTSLGTFLLEMAAIATNAINTPIELLKKSRHELTRPTI
jgi:hypothetical protein